MSTLACTAVTQVIRQMGRDPRLAYLIGPGSQTWEDLTAAYAEANGSDVEDLRRHLADLLRYQPVPRIED